MRKKTVEEARQLFEREVSDHVMTVRLDIEGANSGPYRHVVFARPKSSTYRFELITWPGYLTICGDMGTCTFRRTDDMFKFFRGGNGEINPGYWSEKLESIARFEGHVKFSEDNLSNALDSYVDDWDLGPDEKEDARRAVYNEVGGAESAEYAIRLAGDYEYTDKSGATYTLDDFWESGLEDYTSHYIWLLRAIVWGIRKYDESARLSS